MHQDLGTSLREKSLILGKAFILYASCCGRVHLLKDRRIHAWLVAIAAIYTVSVGYVPHVTYLAAHLPGDDRLFAGPVMTFLMRIMLMVGPLIFLKLVGHGPKNGFYGFSLKDFGLRRYAPLIVIIMAAMFLFSFSPGLHAYYPMYYLDSDITILGMPFWTTFILYEAVYGLQFVAIELFFRGFIPAALYKYAGEGALFISSAMYFFIHFSKPPLEAAASFFGGLILCVIAQSSKTIWSGIVFHLTIAWSMDGFSLLQKLLIQR
jgi:hypothetical protein